MWTLKAWIYKRYKGDLWTIKNACCTFQLECCTFLSIAAKSIAKALNKNFKTFILKGSFDYSKLLLDLPFRLRCWFNKASNLLILPLIIVCNRNSRPSHWIRKTGFPSETVGEIFGILLIFEDGPVVQPENSRIARQDSDKPHHIFYTLDSSYGRFTI